MHWEANNHGAEDVFPKITGTFPDFRRCAQADLKQGYLQDKEPGVRAIVIQALRYTLADTDETYDYILKPILVDMLTVMLGDRVLENRRLALTTLNSAAHNKPELILNNLSQLLPHVMKESIVNPDLIREV